MSHRTTIQVQGLVQGVGFRPFVWRLARELGLRGSVANNTGGVVITIEHERADAGRLRLFLDRLRRETPPAASIHNISADEDISGAPGERALPSPDFIIAPSLSDADEITQVAPDIAVCDDCLRDRETQPHRLRYPFVNCTHCGPRFSIIKDLPYDRPRTTMAAFEMCPACRREYENPRDRRFHAQPIACNHCGPAYHAYDPAHPAEKITDYPRLLALTARQLDNGGIVAIKGIGGYHLACDATNERAVRRLRELKHRDTKPFAVLFADAQNAARHAEITPAERAALESWRRPVVLLRQWKWKRRPAAFSESAFSESGKMPLPLAPDINPGMTTLGCLLPYMPLHHDLFRQLATPALVFTSGNITDTPIAIDETAATAQFTADLLLHHNREIHNRVDDSVVQILGTKTCVLRRSRGYAPEPFFADVPTEGTLAFGAEKTASFALGRDRTVLMSQHIGDLQNAETLAFYEESLTRYQRLFRFTPRRLVCDLHPDYLSTRAAEKMAAENNLSLLRVQHHHAHAAACMLEHRLHAPLIAVVWDATGLGDDGAIWGGEFLHCDRARYTRLAHLENVPMPGGDQTALEPWRMAFSWLRHYRLPLPENFAQRIGPQKTTALDALLAADINCPLTSSAGRLFDALASLLGLCDTATRQAEAPTLLEQHAARAKRGKQPELKAYGSGSARVSRAASGVPPDARERGHPAREGLGGTPKPARETRALPGNPTHAETKSQPISLRPLLEGVLADLRAAVPTPRIAAKIHETLARLIVEKIARLQRQTNATEALLTGGCFQNKLLSERVMTLCAERKITLYIPETLPCNDSGVAAGQLAIATATATTDAPAPSFPCTNSPSP